MFLSFLNFLVFLCIKIYFSITEKISMQFSGFLFYFNLLFQPINLGGIDHILDT